jgi:hypothetical protein
MNHLLTIFIHPAGLIEFPFSVSLILEAEWTNFNHNNIVNEG